MVLMEFYAPLYKKYLQIFQERIFPSGGWEKLPFLRKEKNGGNKNGKSKKISADRIDGIDAVVRGGVGRFARQRTTQKRLGGNPDGYLSGYCKRHEQQYP